MMTALVAMALVLLAVVPAQADMKDGRLRIFVTDALRTAATTVPDGSMGYALDTDDFKWRAAGSWVQMSAGTTLTGANSGTISNGTDTEWKILESSGVANEDLIFDFTADGVTIKSGTGVTTLTTALLWSLSGGAGVITLTSGDATAVLKDADASAFQMGSAGATDLLVFDTTDVSPQLHITGVNAQTALHINVGNLVADELSTLTGVVSFGAGAGAATFTNTAASQLSNDNDSSSFDWGSPGRTDAMRYASNNGAEVFTYTAAVQRPIAHFQTFAAGAGKGLAMLEQDGTAYSTTAGATNHIYYQYTQYNFTTIATATGTVTPASEATGLDLNAGAPGDNDHWEMHAGIGGASGRPFIAGVDPAVKFCATFTLHDVSGTDGFWCGLRTPDVPVVITNYTDYAAIGLGTNTGDIYVNDKTTGGTDTTDNWADDASHAICTLASAAGVVTYTIDGVAPSATDAHTLSDGKLFIPFCQLINTSDVADDSWLTNWSMAVQ